MKKIAALILFLCLIFSLTACSNGTTADYRSAKGEQQAVAERNDVNTPAVSAREEDTTPVEDGGGKVLVAYFSCTGNTEGIAQQIVSILGADSYEIVPEEPYTSADLNYNDSSTRATVEQKDDSARPAISGSVENMEDYDIVFIGYPIWWG